MWEELERLYLELGDAMTASGFNAAPEMPETVPWLAVILMPHIANQSRSDLGWIGDFERCFAAAILRDR